MTTIKERWTEFEYRLLSKVGDDQRRDMRLSFYSGAICLMGLIENAAKSETGADDMNSLCRELNEFYEELDDGNGKQPD